MALINCRECGKQMSSQAKACPGCGSPRISVGLLTKYAFQIAFGLLIAVAMIQCATKSREESKAPALPQATAAPPARATVSRPSRNMTEKVEIDRYLTQFRTYNGKPLRALLLEYGLPVDYVLASPIESFEFSKRDSDRPGDWIVTIAMESGRGKRLPCDMEYIRKAPMVEATVRDGHMQMSPDNPEPLLHWAATGKCLRQ